jgi:hypothetical protein
MYQGETTMNKYDESVRKVAETYTQDFAETCAADERVHELIMTLASEFVNKECPFVSEDSEIDLAMELLMSVTITKI